MGDEANQEGADWTRAAFAAMGRRVRAAVALADRLALIREMIRLNNGRLPCDQIVADWGQGNPILARFGIHQTPDGLSLRSSNSIVLEALDPNLSAAMRLDPTMRAIGSRMPPDAFLLRFSPHKEYRTATQRSAVRALVLMPSSGTLMVSMPTGTGKSLLFQIMAMQARDRDPHAAIAVIVPTIALALDHERTLRSYPGLKASRAFVGSMSAEERNAVRDAFRRGEVPILLLSPEAALGQARGILIEAATLGASKNLLLPCRLAGFVVDEAHIIEQWGRSFRPDFQRLSGLVDQLRHLSQDLRALLLSATLTPSARAVLLQAYRGEGPWLEVRAGMPRYEADLFARNFHAPDERDGALEVLIDQMPRPAIVYTTEVIAAETLYTKLTAERGYGRIGLFTGDTPDNRRQEIVDAWSADEIDLVVATSAFGLGIDKANVRAVVHACLPESSARYYQEVGRAARDGHQALAVALWTRGPSPRNDEAGAFGLASKNWLRVETAMKRWRAILREAQHDDLSWSTDGSNRVLRVSLQAAHDEIGRGDTDYNEGWNETILTLFQRAGALLVLGSAKSAPGAPPAWMVEIIDQGLLAEPDQNGSLWHRFEAVRNDEQREAVADHRRLVRLLEGRGDTCLLTGIFEAVDPEAIGAPDCGRCPSCRRRSVRPPSDMSAWRVTAHWSKLDLPAKTIDPPGLHVLTAETDWDRPATWVKTMTDLGIAQMLVPGEQTHEVAAILAGLGVPLGFVTTWPQFGEGFDLTDLPTAFVPPADLKPQSWFDLVQRSCELHSNHPHYLLVREGLEVGGRPLGQIASIHPPRRFADVPDIHSVNSETSAG